MMQESCVCKQDALINKKESYFSKQTNKKSTNAPQDEKNQDMGQLNTPGL